MNGRYDIGDLLARVPLEDVLQRLGVKTERRGASIQALCPFHQDTKPSLNVYPADGASTAHYHCYACGAHGNAIDLVKRVQGVEFLPAVQWLAQQFGIKSPSRQFKQRASETVGRDTALKFALRIYDEKHDDARFKAWCEERGFDRTSLYRLGIRCVTRGVLVEALQSKGVGERAELTDGLQTLGLVKRLYQRSAPQQWKLNLHDQFQDCFHDGRIVIPIQGGSLKQQQCLGFAGRSLQTVPEEGVAKYLLTAGFEKAKALFNEPAAFDAIKQAQKANVPARLYLVEGFLDALRLHTLGLPAVALMGTSLGNEPMERLAVLAQNSESSAELTYSLFLDNDPAGFAGSERLVRRLLDLRGVNLRWVGMPWRSVPALGKDPDTCLRGVTTAAEALAWLQPFDLPAEAVLLAQALGGQDASDLQPERFSKLAQTVRERAIFRVGMVLRRLYGPRPTEAAFDRLQVSQWEWARRLHAEVATSVAARDTLPSRGQYLEETLPRVALARSLAYHGARRGELPCDEETWQTLGGNARLFDQMALSRLRAAIEGNQPWKQAAPYDAVHLPRKLTADPKVLDDPRRKVMPHPADLLVQQTVLNELLSQRHDRPSATGRMFSDDIPAVRWYASRREVLVTGLVTPINEIDEELNLPKTLSFGYQIDMDVLEGDQTPSDQGMFRPFGQCWREFMASLSRQCHAIGPRVHVLRLDAKRYYDSIQRFVLRDALLKPLNQAMSVHGVPQGFIDVLGLPHSGVESSGAELELKLERLLVGLAFHHQYRDPDLDGRTQWSSELIGIPQGPVLSAYIGTIALFPVDELARSFIHRTAERSEDGVLRPRVGYARYVDDIVLFADSEDLLKQLRELLQAKAGERSIDLIHKGERVRAGSPLKVMLQLNDGRGLAPSVPAWEPPLVGDGETDYSLGGELPDVDRQCALQMLRRVALMHQPSEIAVQVKAVLEAPDLRAGDLGLCARWLWWQVSSAIDAVQGDTTPDRLWESFWVLWNDVCSGHAWANAFAQRGYDWLFAVEGLDKLLDNHPWQENGKFLFERQEDRSRRLRLARLVCMPGFLDQVKPAKNFDHVRRRTWLAVRKAHRLLGDPEVELTLPPQLGGPLTAIEWLCLAAPSIAQRGANHPLNALTERQVTRSIGDGLGLARAVIGQLTQKTDVSDAAATSLAIDFVLNSSPPKGGLSTLASWFNYLLSQFGVNKRLIPHLPAVSEVEPTLFAIDASTGVEERVIYRYTERGSDEALPLPDIDRRFAHVVMRDELPCPADEITLRFAEVSESSALRLAVEKSQEPTRWMDLDHSVGAYRSGLPITHRAARLYYALLAMHQMPIEGSRSLTYVPFRPQLFWGRGNETELYLLAEYVRRDQLGVNAWYHDRDDRVQSVTVPLAGADLWRIGWAVADVLGVAVDISGETGDRDEQLDELETPDEECDSSEVSATRAREQLEAYLLRQQLRKLQGSYLSSAPVESAGLTEDDLPGTVKRALVLLERFPAGESLEAQVRHLLAVETESRAMALRLTHGSSDAMRHVLHQVVPEALNRLPLWVLQGLTLQPSPEQDGLLRPELGLMLSLYQALYPTVPGNKKIAAEPLRVSLVLATIGIGLRGSVAALWGFAKASGASPMPERLTMPAKWISANMERLDPQGDYSVMRKRLADGDWSAICKASPWQWMLSLVGLLDAGFPQALELPELKMVYEVLAQWQTAPANIGDAVEEKAVWPFEALPTLSLEKCDDAMRALPKALCALDALRGMRVVLVPGQKFGRQLHTDEFIDIRGESWQMSMPQFTSLYGNTLPQWRIERRKLTLWAETRSLADNELLSVHTLDHKLGRWFISEEQVSLAHRVALDVGAVSSDHSPDRALLAQSRQADHVDEVPTVASAFAETPPTRESEAPSTPQEPQSAVPAVRMPVERLDEWQSNSWGKRLGRVEKAAEAESAMRGHMRVALFQWRVDDSYSHPISEVGLGGFPFSADANRALESHLAGDLDEVNRAAKRGAEFLWTDDRSVISWPEHRRRVLLRQALRACRELNVNLLVLPEVSVRPDTVVWLKKELLHHPGLAVLAGTFRRFESTHDHQEHLREKLTLLWHPGNTELQSFGLEGDARVMQLQRDKKYRAVAAHEFFRPGTDRLAPLYQEEKVLDELRSVWKRDKTFDQTKALLDALIHGPQKLRHCMELICSELFLLTSPANSRPLLQDFVKVQHQFGSNSTEAARIVDDDITALGDYLAVTQSKRERRSVLVVPACTSRSNDYWHAGQASVLASATATVFCNAVSKGLSVGGSCFIGCDSAKKLPEEQAGVVRLLTPYRGWHHGILQPSVQGALSEADQALVVVDMDPVHVVSGKPRPQLLPEPLSMVAYLPIVEVVRKEDNARALVASLRGQFTGEAGQRAFHDCLMSKSFPKPGQSIHDLEKFRSAFGNLLDALRRGAIDPKSGGVELDDFVKFFGDAKAVRQRIITSLRDHLQQPAPLTKVEGMDLEPAWLDFLIADMTWRQPEVEPLHGSEARTVQPEIRVPPWRPSRK